MPEPRKPQRQSSEETRVAVSQALKAGQAYEGMLALAHSLDVMRDDLREAVRDREEHIRALSDISATQEQMGRTISSLCILVRDGNGQPSLLSRMSAVETKVGSNSSSIDSLRTHNNATVTATVLSRGQLLCGALGMIATITVSMISLIIAVYSHTAGGK